MLCSKAALESLEYPRLRGLLAGQTQSEPGRLLAENLAPLAERKKIETALSELDEAVRLLIDGQAPSLGGCFDIRQVVEQGQAEGSLIAAEELLKIAQSLRVAEDCKRWAGPLEAQPLLSALASQLSSLSELKRRLIDSIGPRGELLDSASFELGDLRYRIRQTRNRVKQQLEQMLSSEQFGSCFQEKLVTVRNGRYVVPLKADHRGQVKGFVQDESSSGQTLYIEPTKVLEGNNSLQQLLREEQREIRKILLQLADLVRRDSSELLNNQRILGRLDLRLAAARLSRQYQGHRPELVKPVLVELKEARHPLLMETDGRIDPAKAVPIDILLPRDCSALVVSGPNTGGKSVALKTLGLQLLMVRSGLHVPCHPDSKLHLFEQLHVDIGDEQSISESLSTFSGHLMRIKSILEQADGETLVLLDEAGTGTDPAEGAALAQSVLDQLRIQGAKTMLTTHLGQLKHFAHAQPGIENAAVEFDPQTLAPKYRLTYGIPGASSAMATARRLGLPNVVLERAKNYLGEGENDSTALLAQLNMQKQELEKELVLAKQARSLAQGAQQLRKQQLQELKSKKKEILARATKQADELIATTESRLKKLRKRQQADGSPKQAVADKEALNAAREELKPFKPKRKRQGAAPEQLAVGELVRIALLGVEAKVERLLSDGVELNVGGKRMRQPLSALEQFSPRRFASDKKGGGQVTRKVAERQTSTQLKLIGQRVDAALVELERFIDDALLGNLQQVEIIHGAGEGILRRAVREFLAKQRGVSAFYAAPAEQGGDNITIAELGDR
ncbi:DNA mismatch repair protein MutS2 [Malonomonas rubra DSM 5091]|uniref:Endonuclease MutS2 n=1 Tax=Malonomonas rubra DSM 5091 TaxID=1122189 RepID=A0A1M6F9M5_MALRU|nr:endonuclease MutS2 [Malonomonas rubra]SHI94309.1 DNA mismatch repair protein MutS2 [Malonomonas rubra DSM 5091]